MAIRSLPSTGGAPLLVRNNLEGPSVFTHSGTKESIEWAGRGDSNGGDVQEVPSEFLTQVQFRNAVHRGIFAVVEESDPEVSEMFDRHQQEWEERITKMKQATTSAMEMTSEDELTMLSCLGPDARKQPGKCGVEVPMKVKALAENPPLCPRHKYMKSQFVREEGRTVVNGKVQHVWSLPIIEKSERLD